MAGKARWLCGPAVFFVLMACLSACAERTPSAGQAAGGPGSQPIPRTSPSAIRNLREAAYSYARYCARVPTDLLGLRRLVEACARLEEAGVQDANCRIGDSTAAVLRAAWLEQVAAAQPQYLVGQRLDDGWMLLGYDVNEERLVRGEPVDLLLYWEGPPSVSGGSEQDGWYRAGERWVQVLEGAHNLVLNGSFELGAEAGSPTGFPWDIFRAGPGTRRLVSDTRTGQRTTVALLDNTEVYSRTSFASAWIPVNPDGLYLQSGWLKSVGGDGWLGRRWKGNIPGEVRTYSYVATDVSAVNWHHYTGLTRPMEGATHCQIWLLNWQAVGAVYFDGVLFVEVGLPGAGR